MVPVRAGGLINTAHTYMRGTEAKVRMEMKFPFVSRKLFERTLENARTAELERDKGLEKSASLTVVLSKSSLQPIAVVRTQLEWARFCASARFRRIQQEDY